MREKNIYMQGIIVLYIEAKNIELAWEENKLLPIKYK